MTEGCNKDTSLSNGTWITIGSFDGLHLGHQKIVNEIVERSKNKKASCLVVTFFPHPLVHLKQITDPFYLTTPEEKNRILSEKGVDSILTLHFDETTSRLSPRDFIQTLFDQINFSNLLVGYDFRLGADRAGSVKILEQLGSEMGFYVEAIKPVLYLSHPVSSSRIRSALINGDIISANKMLGFPYSIEGTIVHGDGRGKHINLPTANLAVWEKKLIPTSGVYAAFVEIDDREYSSVVSIGHRPTFYENPTLQTIETHILDFSEDIYDKEMKIKFITRLRDEEKYNSIRELLEQIQIDINNTREILAHGVLSSNLSS